MRPLTEQKFNERMSRIQEDNIYRERARMLDEEREKGKTPRKYISMSKAVLIGIILLCLEIVIFCEYAMIALYDASSMYALIGIPAALAPTILGYYNKSKAENTEGGIVYDAAMAEIFDREFDGNEFEDTTIESDDVTEEE